MVFENLSNKHPKEEGRESKESIKKREKKAKRRSLRNAARAAALASLGFLSGVSGGFAQDSSKTKSKVEQKVEYTGERKNANSLAAEKDSADYKEIKERNEKKKQVVEDIQNFILKTSYPPREKTVFLFEDQLLDDSPIEIDGFINQITVDSNEELSIQINGRPLKEVDSKVTGVSKYTGWHQNDYTPLVDTENIQVAIDAPELDRPIKLKIKQDLFQKIETVTLPYSQNEQIKQAIDTTHVTLLGSNKKELLDKIPDLQNRLEAIAEGAQAVEGVFNTNIVDTLGVIESDKMNAFVTHHEKNKDSNGEKLKKSTLFYFRGLLKNLSEKELNLTARHEALHHFTDRSGYTFLKEFKKLEKSTDEKIFQFVKEASFFNASHSLGHPDDGTHELVTSFVNSLINIEKIQENFQETDPIGWAGETKRYPKETQKKVINWYQEATRILLDHAQESIENGMEGFQNDTSFFKKKLKYLDQLERQI